MNKSRKALLFGAAGLVLGSYGGFNFHVIGFGPLLLFGAVFVLGSIKASGTNGIADAVIFLVAMAVAIYVHREDSPKIFRIILMIIEGAIYSTILAQIFLKRRIGFEHVRMD
ncbi:MAG: hypothetical protein HZC01_03905 [Candidatus Kerfeldbacteria bacterium]|nr:hypothetical protein [Candidatus Kerfeldbacteria bacterium]